MTITGSGVAYECLPSLTLSERKLRYYLREPAFREACHRVLQLSQGFEVEAQLQQHALVVLRPDAIAFDKVCATLDFIDSIGFQVVYCRAVDFTKLLWHTVWLYQLNCATLDRLAICDLIFGSMSSVLVLVRSRRGEHQVSACSRLTAAKGPAEVKDRDEGCLRSRLASPNQVLTFVHTTDEPIDIVRELFLMTNGDVEPAIRALLSPSTSDALSEARRLAAAISRNCETTPNGLSLEPAAALERLLRDLRRSSGVGAASESSAIDAVCWALETERPLSFGRLADVVGSASPAVNVWDAIEVGAAYSVHDTCEPKLL